MLPLRVMVTAIIPAKFQGSGAGIPPADLKVRKSYPVLSNSKILKFDIPVSYLYSIVNKIPFDVELQLEKY